MKPFGNFYTLVHEIFAWVLFSRIFFSRAPPFFSFSRNTNFRATAKKVWFYQTKTSQMLVFCWYLVREGTKKIKICLLRIAQFYFRALLVARITLIRADYIFAQEHCAKIKLTRKFHELRYIFLYKCIIRFDFYSMLFWSVFFVRLERYSWFLCFLRYNLRVTTMWMSRLTTKKTLYMSSRLFYILNCD